MNFLAEITNHKRESLARSKRTIPLAELRRRAESVATRRNFGGALQRKTIAVIAEVKQASPSRGLLVKEFDAVRIATEYEQGGAAALSVLTEEEYFRGDPLFIAQIRKKVSLPILRKDFIVDEYQIYESVVLQADALLLIVAALDAGALRELFQLAASIGIEVLIEVHAAPEIDLANLIGGRIIGINNRDLKTFETSLDHSLKFIKEIRPDAVKVSESGIATAADVIRLRTAGFDAVLVGESIVVQPDRAAALKDLVGD